MMHLVNLRLAQDGFRLPKAEIQAMIQFVTAGGKYDLETLQKYESTSTDLIALTRFEDGNVYVRDGVHRISSVYLGRAEPILFDEEYRIEDMPYSMYMETNHKKGWFTPFDPRKEVRRANLKEYRDSVMEVINAGGDVEEFIKQNHDKYLVAREDYHDSIRPFVSKFWFFKGIV